MRIKDVRVHERLQETKEASSCPKDKIFPHRARIFPVSEPYAIMVWPTTEEQDHSQEQERDDGNDLDTCEYEFRFSISFDNCRQPSELRNQMGEDGQLTENVEQKYDNQYKNNPNRNVYLESSALKYIV